MFQFLYGAIGSLALRSSTGAHVSFNSYMVRLEASSARISLTSECCFNSYMVRLEAINPVRAKLQCPVSIPIWCDWKTCVWTVTGVTLTFQFLYGAIGRARFWNRNRARV